MAGFVRSTKFRHVFGTPQKKDHCYDNIRITKSPWESNMCDVNGKFLAVVLESQGGGAFLVCPLGKYGRFDINYPKVCGHRGLVLDLAWNPFDDNEIASSSEDCLIMIWTIPDDGLKSNVEKPTQTLEFHQRKVGVLAWHPTAEGILASAAADGVVCIWNTQSGECVSSIAVCSDVAFFSLTWNNNGSLLASTTKDKKIRIIDPRKQEIVAEHDSHAGGKPSKAVFCGKYIFSTGFSKSNDRQYALWDSAKLDQPLVMEAIDSASGVNNIFYDEGTRMVYLVGKGDSTIRYYEITDSPPYIHFLSMYQSKDPQRGAGCMPKRHLNFMECEVMRFYKLSSKGMVEPLVMTVPRKSAMFQDDIYPPCFSGVAALSAEEWLGGANKNPIRVNITKEGLGSKIGGGISSPTKAGTSTPGSLSKQSSVSSSASEPLKIERENSPISLTASGDFDDSQYKREIQSLKAQLESLKNENQSLKNDLKKKESIIAEIKQLVK